MGVRSLNGVCKAIHSFECHTKTIQYEVKTSRSKATEGTQVSMESGKTSWVLLFTHFHIKRSLLPSNPSLEAKAFWRVTREKEKGSSKEAGKAESRGNPVNADSSQKSWCHLAKKLLCKLWKLISQLCAEGSQAPGCFTQ